MVTGLAIMAETLNLIPLACSAVAVAVGLLVKMEIIVVGWLDMQADQGAAVLLMIGIVKVVQELLDKVITVA